MEIYSIKILQTTQGNVDGGMESEDFPLIREKKAAFDVFKSSILSTC